MIGSSYPKTWGKLLLIGKLWQRNNIQEETLVQDLEASLTLNAESDQQVTWGSDQESKYPRRLYKYNYPCTELLNKTSPIRDTPDLIIIIIKQESQQELRQELSSFKVELEAQYSLLKAELEVQYSSLKVSFKAQHTLLQVQHSSVENHLKTCSTPSSTQAFPKGQLAVSSGASPTSWIGISHLPRFSFYNAWLRY